MTSRPAGPSSTLSKLALLSSLYLSQGLPFGFFTKSLPVLLRQEGVSLPAISLTSLLFLPWAAKFLWAPWLDRGPFRIGGHGLQGRRRSVIVPLQLLSVVALVAVALLPPSSSMAPILVLVLVINFLAATQDIATDGLAVDLLTPSERGLANGVQVAGYRLGMILGGGVLLIVLDQLGWTRAFLLMAIVLLLATAPILGHREKPVAATLPPTSWSEALKELLARPGMRAWLGVLLLYKAVDAFAVGVLSAFFVDIGRSLTDAGVQLGVVGSTAGLLGAILGGYLVGRFSRVPMLLGFGALQIVAAALYAWPALHPELNDVWLAGIVAVDHVAGGMSTAAIFTLMMDVCRPGRGATDYTLQASVVVVGTGLAAAAAGLSAEHLGHAGHFLFAACLAAAALAIVARAAPALWAQLSAASALERSSS